ncbi:MAG: hypothetical protein PVF43_05520 [Candidatus Eiseniibacteriota bacterium]|jgi:hypothetical protein
MHRLTLLMVLMISIWGTLLLTPPARSAVEISCNGDACNLFGTLDYNYILRNNGGSPVTVTEFYVATNDLDEGNYSSFSHPAGFQVTVDTWETLNNLYGVTEQPTTGLFTDHGMVPSAAASASEGAVLFTGGSFTLQIGGTVSFGFNHDWAPYDMGWVVEHPDEQNSSEGSIEIEMAGPYETLGYNLGFVHGVGENAMPVNATTWGQIKATLRR